MHARPLIPIFAMLMAAGVPLAAPAEARGGDRFWSGRAPTFSNPPAPAPQPAYYRERSPHRGAPALRHAGRLQRRDKAPAVSAEKATPAPKHADGRGRAYDFASKAWFDGEGECWRGKEVWAFKRGTWFYGPSRWRESDGHWRTDGPAPPTAVDCKAIPAFAAKLRPAPEQRRASSATLESTLGREPPYGKERPAGRMEALADPPAGGPRSLVQADGTPSRLSECRRYFGSVGEMLPVSCDP